MPISPNIRPACDGTTTPLPTFGGCFQNADADVSSVKIKHNTTVEKNYAHPATPAYISPFATAQLNGVPDCSPYETAYPTFFVCGDGTNGNVWCSPVSASYFTSSVTISASAFDVGSKYTNWYTQSNDTGSNPCSNNRGIGFKNTYGKKAWVGRKGFTTSDGYHPTDWDWCCGPCSYENAQSNDTTKYRTISANTVYNRTTKVYNQTWDYPGGDWYCDGVDMGPIVCVSDVLDHTDTYTAHAAAVTTVDKFGNTTVATCTSGSSGLADYSGEAFTMLYGANFGWNDIITYWCKQVGGAGGFTDSLGCGPDVVTKNGIGSWHVEWHTGTNTPVGSSTPCVSRIPDPQMVQVACGTNPPATKQLICEMDITPTRLEVKVYGFKACVTYCSGNDITNTWEKIGDYIWEFTADALYITGNSSYNTVSIDWNDLVHTELTAALSDVYTTQMVYDDIVNNLISKWDMNRDMPWRSDSDKTKGPLVSYDEIQDGTDALPSVPLCVTNSLYSGKIMGKPGPVGIDNVWMPEHKNYCVCAGLYDPANFIFFERDDGAWSSAVANIPNATQAVNLLESNNLPDGAFVGMNFMYTFPASQNGPLPAIIQDDVVWIGKYAEAIYPKQSFNYARPCGADRLQLSASTNRCISGSISGLTIPTNNPANGYTTGNKVWVCGTSGLDGMWTVSSATNNSVTLTEPRIASASRFPTLPVDNCGTGMVAQLRWPSSNYAICGRIGINSIDSGSAGGVLTCSVDTATYLVNGDKVITNGSLNGSYTVGVIDSTHITLNGTTGGGVYGGGQMYSQFAVDWKWNDTSGKGDFVYYTWNIGSNIRDWGEYNRIVTKNYENSLGYSGNCINPAAACGLYAVVPSLPATITSVATTTCISIGACAAAAVYFSPNSESFTSKTNLGWAASTIANSLDSVYGGLIWQGIVKQTMDDPYYQAPPCPCSYGAHQYGCNIIWKEDDGACNSDNSPNNNYYYAARNVYEARSTLPLINGVSAPLLVGATLPVSMTQPYAPSTFPLKEGCAGATYLVNIMENPWELNIYKEAEVCSGCRWSEIYFSNGIMAGPKCSMIEVGI